MRAEDGRRLEVILICPPLDCRNSEGVRIKLPEFGGIPIRDPATIEQALRDAPVADGWAESLHPIGWWNVSGRWVSKIGIRPRSCVCYLISGLRLIGAEGMWMERISLGFNCARVFWYVVCSTVIRKKQKQPALSLRFGVSSFCSVFGTFNFTAPLHHS